MAIKNRRITTVSYQISRLSELVEIHNLGHKKLLLTLRPKINGLMLKLGSKRAIFLPSVWEQLNIAETFLAALKQKGGLE